ncbi:MAG TPA: PEGA domain-containing protein [Planctomycetota bacterium]|nr:PEGA domain-containing protein [Planctomycetota bacterium]
MRGAAAALGLALALLTGCVERLLAIRSDPPDAEVTLDGKGVGRTPVDIPFEWYGGREIIVRKAGFKTVHTIEHVGAPWYQIFPFDFFTDVLLPFTIRDVREFDYKLEKESEPVPPATLRERANELKKKLDDKQD